LSTDVGGDDGGKGEAIVGVSTTRHRFLLQASFDSLAWVAGLTMATLLRFDFDPSRIEVRSLAVMVLIAVVAQAGVGRAFGLYVYRWRYGTLEEMAADGKAVGVVTALLTVVNLVPPFSRALPVSVPVMGGCVALCLGASGRFLWRLQLDRWSRVDEEREPIIIFGAGDAGLRVVSAMLRSGPYEPVAFLDDNPQLRNLRVRNVPVEGTRHDLSRVVTATGATKMVIAIPSAAGETVRDLARRTDELGVDTLVLPPMAELIGRTVEVQDIRPLTETDLLGRREVTLDIDGVAGFLTGKRVLVTGAGGSIGSELCRQIQRFGPASLVMIDRDESALQSVQLSIEGIGLLDRRELVVCCIRDKSRLEEVFEEHRPEVVFHAAALKHLPLLEMHPEEGWKTNVWGTQHLLDLAGQHGVERFVNISTDKAAEPVSVLGRTKRLAEQLTSHAGRVHSGTYLSVRFGNVLGSRGSVLPLFRAQIEAGGPVTVTDPEVSRFFMTIPEACELVIQAGALGSDGQALVLDMGEPIRIADLARRLIAESGQDVELVFTGLRPGEKLNEVLFGEDEQPVPSGHELISRVDVPPLAPEVVAALDPFSHAPVIDLRHRVAQTTARRAKRSV
jgi:FlaA1/EpsC-like NDP-sugar epimerase